MFWNIAFQSVYCYRHLYFHVLVSMFWHWTTNWCGIPKGKPLFLLRTFLGLPFFCVGFKLCRSFPVQLGMSFGVVLFHLTFGQACWWNFMHVTSDINRIILTAYSMVPWLLESFPPSATVLWAWVSECFITVFLGTGLHKSAFWLGVVSCTVSSAS